MSSRRLVAVLVVLLAVFVVVAALSFGGGATRSAGEPVPAEVASRASVERAGRERARKSGERPASASPVRAEPAARELARAALRRGIVDALAHRGVELDRAATRTDDREAEAAPVGTLIDRTGGRPALLERLDADFMPLADECVAQARERSPDLRGLVALDVELLAEREIGAIVETVAPAQANEIDDPELLECLQETLLSMALPGEAVDGREGFMISLRTEPDSAAPGD